MRKKIYFDSTDTYIYGDATSDEKLILGADSDIVLEPDVKLDIDTATIDLVTQSTTIELKQQVDALAFDGAADNILNIDAANNRVGIGTASPGVTLEVVGTTSWLNSGSNAFMVIEMQLWLLKCNYGY